MTDRDSIDYDIRRISKTGLYDERADLIFFNVYSRLFDTSIKSMGEVQIKYIPDMDLFEIFHTIILPDSTKEQKSYKISPRDFIEMVKSMKKVNLEYPTYIWKNESETITAEIVMVDRRKYNTENAIAMAITGQEINSSHTKISDTIIFPYTLMHQENFDLCLDYIISLYYTKCLKQKTMIHMYIDDFVGKEYLIIKETLEDHSTSTMYLKIIDDAYGSKFIHILNIEKENIEDRLAIEKTRCSIAIKVNHFIRIMKIGLNLSRDGIDWIYNTDHEFGIAGGKSIYMSIIQKKCENSYSIPFVNITHSANFLRIKFNSENIAEFNVNKIENIINLIEILYNPPIIRK